MRSPSWTGFSPATALGELVLAVRNTEDFAPLGVPRFKPWTDESKPGMTSPTRLPDAVSLEAVLAGLDPASVNADLVPALVCVLPGFEFRIASVDDDSWLGWVFLMTRGHSVEAETGRAIAARLPDRDARVLLRWADKPYGF